MDSEISAGARAILDAATQAFARAGFDSVSLTDVATQAKVCKANIFHHFKSKEALYLEVMREACKGHAEFTEALLVREDLSSTEKLRALIAFDFESLFGNELRSHLIVREIMNAGCRTGRKLIQPVFIRNFTAVTAVIRQGQTRGEFRPQLDPAIAAWMLGATSMMLFQNRESLGQFPGFDANADAKPHAERVYQTLLEGFLAPSALAPRKAISARSSAKTSTRARR